MRRTTAGIYYRRGRAIGYTLYCEGQAVDPAPVRGVVPVISTFAEAYGLFEVIRLHYDRDGTPIEG